MNGGIDYYWGNIKCSNFVYSSFFFHKEESIFSGMFSEAFILMRFYPHNKKTRWIKNFTGLILAIVPHNFLYSSFHEDDKWFMQKFKVLARKFNQLLKTPLRNSWIGFELWIHIWNSWWKKSHKWNELRVMINYEILKFVNSVLKNLLILLIINWNFWNTSDFLCFVFDKSTRRNSWDQTFPNHEKSNILKIIFLSSLKKDWRIWWSRLLLLYIMSIWIVHKFQYMYKSNICIIMFIVWNVNIV